MSSSDLTIAAESATHTRAGRNAARGDLRSAVGVTSNRDSIARAVPASRVAHQRRAHKRPRILGASADAPPASSNPHC
jgi:hypothetical protein